MRNKKLLTTLGAVALLGVIGVGSTFAYLSDQTDEVTNTFTVGKVTFDKGEDGLGSGLRESAVARNEDGNYVDNDGKGVWSVTGNTYTDLVAGEEVHKDPTVIMGADSEDAWVFAKITNPNKADVITSIDWNTEEWVDVTAAYKEANDIEETIDYVVYAKTETIAASESSTIFNSITLSDDIDGDTEIQDIVIDAFAIQASGFENYEAAIGEVSFN